MELGDAVAVADDGEGGMWVAGAEVGVVVPGGEDWWVVEETLETEERP